MWRLAEGAAFLQGGVSSQLSSMAALVRYVKAIESLTGFGADGRGLGGRCRRHVQNDRAHHEELRGELGQVRTCSPSTPSRKRRTTAAQELQLLRAWK